MNSLKQACNFFKPLFITLVLVNNWYVNADKLNCNPDLFNLA